VRLGRQVQHGVHICDQLGDHVRVANVAAHESIARILLDVREVAEVPGVGQEIEIDDLYVLVGLEQVTHQVGADEPRATGDQQLHEVLAIRGPPTPIRIS